MSLSISDARVFSAALKKARQKRKLTQAECAELLDHSVSFQKDLERGRCSTYQKLLRLLPLCDEKSLSALVAAAAVLTDADQNAMLKEQSESIRDEQT